LVKPCCGEWVMIAKGLDAPSPGLMQGHMHHDIGVLRYGVALKNKLTYLRRMLLSGLDVKIHFSPILVAALCTTAVPSSADGADAPSREQQLSPEQRKELKKLRDAYGAGELSSKEYKKRKEALLLKGV
jgi:hypothetical protein